MPNSCFNGDGAGVISGPLSCLRKLAPHSLGGKGETGPGVCKLFSVKGQVVNIAGLAGLAISITAIQLCHCSTKAVIEKRKSDPVFQ